MAYPPSVSVAQIMIEPGIDFHGEPVDLSVWVTPVLGGRATHLVHRASGTPVVPFTVEFKAKAGDPANVIPLPHVDQQGFFDGAGNEVTHWAYRAEVRFKQRGQHVPTVREFQVLVGQEIVDFDDLGEGEIMPPASAPVPVVTSVAGLVGPVSGEQLAGAMGDRFAPTAGSPNYAPATGSTVYATKTEAAVDDAEVAAHVNNTTSTTRGAIANVIAAAAAVISKVAKGELILNVRDYGAKGDGTTDDGPAFRTAVAAAAGKRLFIPEGTYNYRATGVLQLAAGTTLVGVPGRTIINFDSTLGSHTNFLSNEGNNVRLEGVTINRVSNFPAIIINAKNYDGFTFRDVVINGNRDVHTAYCHGFQVSDGAGTLSGLSFDHCVLTKTNFGLFQNNSSQAIVRDPSFNRCIFASNYATDLEFNSPVSDTFNVRVTDCVFSDNKSATVTGGFAVGLAHVTRAKIKGCAFDGYNNEPVHVEDWSSRVIISGNHFRRCGLVYAGHVRVTSGSNWITITDNDFDATANEPGASDINIVHSTAGKTDGSLTPGGRAHTHPQHVVVTGNNITAWKCRGVYMSDTVGSVISNNAFIGAGKVTNLAYDWGNNGYAVEVWNGAGVTVQGNTIRGFKDAFSRRVTGSSSGGAGYAVFGNTVSDCQYGVAVVNPGGATIAGNTITNTVHPMIVGQGSGTSRPVSITGNAAIDCKYPMEIDGRLVVVASGAAAVGGPVTLPVESLGLSISIGHVLTFSGGGVFTLTKDYGPGVTSIEGNLTGAAVSSGQHAVLNGLKHSWTGANNRVSVSGNIDTAAGTYGGMTTSSPDGVRWRLTVANGGTVTATAV